ncbi:MAG: NAD(+) synthase [Gemmatimonadetes bacterium]|nr:NAD(+) synthase [Gemmatimonadota bacterium]MBT5057079.1 NAD(+) synthase [Gemmatimonadota bacterium]MBT5144646.1 NAD(+) synthase [Gemmatimonadota bacterium]MBT5587393.1 NAD(+) synthase [Gemmatimonadota bacterium]MBT5963257.1 NAD(+) synthase [Gemmatimonadota bacterium]
MAVVDLPRLALAQMRVSPGCAQANIERMLRLIETARAAHAEVVVFSEMCVSGYLIGDLWEVDAYVSEWESASALLCAASTGLTLLFGNVATDAQAIGEDGRRRKYNAVVVCHDGHFVDRPLLPPGLPKGIHPKTLQPNYRFFDDDRHFYSLRHLADATGKSVDDWIVPFEVPFAGGTFRFGAQLCEDLWCDDYYSNATYLDTYELFAQRNVDAVFNLSASPWTWQKNDKRHRTVRQILSRRAQKETPIPFLYVNQVGAQNNGKNIVVFDGDTTAYEADGSLAAQAAPWRESLLCVGGGAAPDLLAVEEPLVVTVPVTVTVGPATGGTQVESVLSAIVAGLRHLDELRGGQGRYLVALSGGVDSSVVACLLERAFGHERVFAVNMPTRHNAAITQQNARQLAATLDIDYLSVSIEDLYGTVADLISPLRFARSEGNYSSLVDENIQARIRFSDILSGIAAKHDLLFTNNGNKTELALGYTTLYGDLSGAVAPIADLYKVQVFELGRYLNHLYDEQVIPENLLNRETVPSAELSAAQDVTQGLGDPIKYGYHDAVLRQLIEYRQHPADLIEWMLTGVFFERLDWRDDTSFSGYFPDVDTWLDDLDWLDRQLRISYFKRIQAPPLIVLSKRAFGFDLRETQWVGARPTIYDELVDRARQLTTWPPSVAGGEWKS